MMKYLLSIIILFFCLFISVKPANAQCIFNIADWSENGVRTCLESGGVIGLIGTVGNWGENYRRTADIVRDYNNGKAPSEKTTIELRLFNDSRPHTSQEIQSAVAMILSNQIGTNPILRINNEPTDSYAWVGMSYDEKIAAIARSQYDARQAIKQAGGGILLASEMLDLWNGQDPQNVWAAITQYIQSHQSEFPGITNYHDLYDVYSINGYFEPGNFGSFGNNSLTTVLSALPPGKAWRFSEFGFKAPGAAPTYEVNNLRRILTDFVSWLANNPNHAANFAGFGIFTKDPHQSTSDISAAIMEIVKANPGLGSALIALEGFSLGNPAIFNAWLANLLAQGIIVECKDINGNRLGFAPDQNSCIVRFGQALGSSCGGPIDVDQVGFKAEMAQWGFTAKFNVKDIANESDLYSAANYIKSNFVLETVGTYPHFNLEPFANQLVGSKVAGTQNVASRVEDFKAPTQLSSRIPGKVEPAGFSIGSQEYQKPNESEEDYTARVFETSTSSLGKKEKYGEKAEMKATNFKACIQRLACNPAVEDCLLESYSFESAKNGGCGNNLEKCKCKPGDDPIGCISFGKVFTLGGKLSFEEPADLLTVSKALDNLGKKYVDIKDPTSPYSKAPSNNIYTNNVNYNAYTPRVAQAKVEKAKAAEEPGALNNSLTVGATSNGGGLYNVNYRYCIWHVPRCGMGDLRSTINGTQVNLWKSTTSENMDDACLEPTWGEAPAFNNVSLPFTVTVITGGNRAGPRGTCPDSVSASCTIEIDPKTGLPTTECGKLPEPPPLDCRNCPSWAPASACEKIVKQTLPTVNECSDGKCQSGIRDVEEKIPFNSTIDKHFSFAGRPWAEALFNLLGINTISCKQTGGDVCSDGAGVVYGGACGPGCRPAPGYSSCKTIPGPGSFQCAFNASEYILYAYPTTNLIGDYGAKSSYVRPLEAMFKIPGQTDQYFTKESAMATISLKLKADSVTAGKVSGSSWDGQEPYFKIRDNDTTKINVEYYDFYQPLYSSICLSDQFSRLPKTSTLAYQDNCSSFPFFAGNRNGSNLDNLNPINPITFSGNVENEIAAAASNNGVPKAVLKAILEAELGSVNFNPNNYTCTRNSATATGPMQITDGTVFSYLNGNEAADWNIKRWNAGEDFSSDGRCQIQISMEIAARILKGKASYAVSKGWITGLTDFMLNPQMAVYASGGYYGTRECNPTAETVARWGKNISYCDFFIYKVGQYGGYQDANPPICQTLNSRCDGIGPFDDGEGAQSGPTQGTNVKTQIEPKTVTPITNPKGNTKTQQEILKDIQFLVNKYKDQIKSDNPSIDDLPKAMIDEMKALGEKYKN